MFTADILTAIMHRSSKVLDYKLITRAVTLDLSKGFDKLWELLTQDLQLRNLSHSCLSYPLNNNDSSVNFVVWSVF